ncbi:ricin-type beta-trefoil lectin domain-like-domain-containing protein [Earliella scabrosa]|nr:ricin-type beta-trefoil lectin domain-like-domain-containing protein [Earliella scabrosa]
MASVQGGKTYKITNAKGGTVLDLSGGQENSPITGYNFNGGSNQQVRPPSLVVYPLFTAFLPSHAPNELTTTTHAQWLLEDSGNGHFKLKNAATGLYIGFQGEPSNGAPVSAVRNGTEFEIKQDKTDNSVLRCFVAGTLYCLDLSDHGNPNPGTPVTLWKKWEGGTNQTWRFEEVNDGATSIKEWKNG